MRASGRDPFQSVPENIVEGAAGLVSGRDQEMQCGFHVCESTTYDLFFPVAVTVMLVTSITKSSVQVRDGTCPSLIQVHVRARLSGREEHRR